MSRAIFERFIKRQHLACNLTAVENCASPIATRLRAARLIGNFETEPFSKEVHSMNAQAIFPSGTNATHTSSQRIGLENAQAIPVRLDVVPLPPGMQGGRGQCPECRGNSLTAVLIGRTSTVEDPDVYCNQCGFLW
jgi:hypothetical protein